ncbi:MAG: cyclic-di-AMP receptor [Streptococcaceae bacterium]|jgi:uncharacterized protein YaaQ|nr:cyclic-di-AMP receptor [Streptococcaceae bacterium]
MKMIYAIVQDKDANKLSNRLIDENIRATKLASTGGFLKSGNSTFIIGVEDEKVSAVKAIIKETCQTRIQYTSSPLTMDLSLETGSAAPVEVEIGGATVFVLPIESFDQF